MSGTTCGMAADGRAMVGSILYAAGPSPHHPPSKEPLYGVGRLPDTALPTDNPSSVHVLPNKEDAYADDRESGTLDGR